MNKILLVTALLLLAAPAVAQEPTPGEPAPVEAAKPDDTPPASESATPEVATPDPEHPASVPASEPGSRPDTQPRKKCAKCKGEKKCPHCARAKGEGKCPHCAKSEGKCPHCAKAQGEGKCPRCAKGEGKCPDCAKAERKCPHGAKAERKCPHGAKREAKGKCPHARADCKDGKCKKPGCTKEGGTRWAWSASFRPRGELFVNRHFGLTPDVLNYPVPDEVDVVTQQTRLGVTATRGALSGHLQIQHVAAWGVFGGDALTDGVIGLHQGWFEVAPHDTVKVRIGRQELAYGAHRVLGNVGWSQVGRAWDGARIALALPADTTLDIIGAQYAEGWVEMPATYTGKLLDEDAYLVGLYASSKAADPAFDVVDAYLLYDASIESPEAEKDKGSQFRRGLLTAGVRLHGKWDPVDAEVESAFQTGKSCVADPAGTCTKDDVDQAGFFVDAEVGFTLLERLRLFVGFGQATGDDPDTDENEAYNHLYPTAHKFLGYMDIIGPRSNVRELRGGAGYKYSDKRGSFDLVVHDFTRLQPKEERVGLEIDLTAGWKFYDGLSGLFGWALFLPAEGISIGDEDPVGNAQWVFVQGVARF